MRTLNIREKKQGQVIRRKGEGMSMNNEAVYKDGHYYLRAQLNRVNGLIKKGIVGKNYASFNINVDAECFGKSYPVTLTAEFKCKDGTIIKSKLHKGNNPKEIAASKLKNGSLVSVLITAVYHLPLFKTKTMKVRVERRIQ